ncbi:Flp family type IVb pilin [Inquilinus limosus]|uniref:Flp family type IVb pilin n=1 Tax=Inquilinus limosus TaxID=171674 RepID=UPI003F18197C
MLRKFFKKARQVARDEQGITAVEYAILGALIAVGLAAAIPTLTGAFSDAFTKISEEVGGGGSGGTQ